MKNSIYKLIPLQGYEDTRNGTKLIWINHFHDLLNTQDGTTHSITDKVPEIDKRFYNYA